MRNWAKECEKKRKRMRERERKRERKTALRDENTCGSNSKILITLVMLSISLYYISIVTEFTTYCTWYYIYTGCYTLSISKTSISPRGRSERGLARKAQESKITRREKIERRQISSKTMEAWTASNMPTGADISLSLYLQVLINPRVFLVQIFNIDTKQDLLLRKIVIRTGANG